MRRKKDRPSIVDIIECENVLTFISRLHHTIDQCPCRGCSCPEGVSGRKVHKYRSYLESQLWEYLCFSRDDFTGEFIRTPSLLLNRLVLHLVMIELLTDNWWCVVMGTDFPQNPFRLIRLCHCIHKNCTLSPLLCILACTYLQSWIECAEYKI